MKKNAISKAIPLFLLCITLLGCGPSKFHMDFEGFNNPDINIAEYKKFSFLPTDSEFPLKEKMLFQYIRDVMQQKGFIYDDNQPQFLVFVKMAERSTTEVRPVRSRRVSTYQPAPVGSKVNNYGTWQNSYETTGGGSTTISTITITVNFIDSIKKDSNGNPLYLWQGQASSSQKVKKKVSHSIGSEKCLILGILQQYPNEQTSKRIHVLSEQCN